MESENKPEADQILSAVKESGYLLEQEIAIVLENLGFEVQTASAFEDIEEGKSREIDVLATQGYYHNDSKKLSIFARILCECKNNTNPFVFIGRDKKRYDRYFVPKEIVFPVEGYYVPLEEKPETKILTAAFNYFKLEKSHHYFTDSQKAVQFCKIVKDKSKWKALHDGIYDGIFIPLVKALEFQKAQNKEYFKNYNAVFAFYPMVVCNAELFYLNSNTPNALPIKVDHISFIREINSKNIHGKYLIDFVNKNSLEKFVRNKIKPLIDSIVDLAYENPQKFIKYE